jgi:hypothetical protein
LVHYSRIVEIDVSACEAMRRSIEDEIFVEIAYTGIPSNAI